MNDTIFKVGFIIFDVIVLIFLILYLLVAYLKGWKRTLLNLCAFLIPFIIYLFMADKIAEIFMKINLPGIGSIYDLVLNQVKEITKNNAEGATLELCESITVAVVRFATYYVCLLICLLLAQINRIIFRCTLKGFIYPGGDSKVKPSMPSRLIGLGVGFARFIFASVILFFPIYGIINVAQTGIKDYAIINEMTKKDDSQTTVSEEDFSLEELSEKLNGSIAYKTFTVTKDKDTDLSIPAKYLGTILKVKTSTGSYNIIKEYGNIHATLKIVSRMEISEDVISFEKLTKDDVKILHNTIGKTKLLKLLAPAMKEKLIVEMEKESKDAALLDAITNMDASKEADILIKALNESLDILVGLKLNVNHLEDLLLEESLVTSSNKVLNVLMTSSTIVNYALPKLSEKLIELVDDPTKEMNVVLSPEKLEICIKTDVSSVLAIYQKLAKNNNLHNYIFNEGEFITGTDIAASTLEEAIDGLFELSIVKGNEKTIIKFALTKAKQDKLSYEVLFKGLNPDWQEEGKIIGKIVKEIMLLPKEAKDFDNFSIETLVLKNASNEYMYDSVIKEISKSNIFRLVSINLLETFTSDSETSNIKEIMNLLNIDNIKNVSSQEFYQELIGLLQILDTIIETNILDEEKELNLTEENVELLINRIFASILVKGKESEIVNYLLDKTNINAKLQEMGTVLNLEDVDWETEPTKLIEIFKSILAFGDITSIDFNQIIASKDESTNPKIVRLLTALRDSDIFGTAIFDMIDKMVSETEYTDITNLFNLRALENTTIEEFKVEISNLLDIIDLVKKTNITNKEELNIDEGTIEVLITKIFDSIVTKGKEPEIFNYIMNELNLTETLTNMNITLDPYDSSIDWEKEPSHLIEIFKAIMKFGNINEIDFNTLMKERNETTQTNLTALFEALDSSTIFSPHLKDMIMSMALNAGYIILLTDEDMQEIRLNTWANEVKGIFEVLDICDEILYDSSTYDAVDGTSVKNVMLIASTSVIASKTLGEILMLMLGQFHLNINPKDENGNYKYDFTSRQILKDNAESVGKLIDIKHALDSIENEDAKIKKSIEAVKNLNNDEITKDTLNAFVDNKITADFDTINFENEGQIIEDVYNKYNSDRENFNIANEPELREKVEKSEVAKHLLQELGII